VHLRSRDANILESQIVERGHACYAISAVILLLYLTHTDVAGTIDERRLNMPTIASIGTQGNEKGDPKPLGEPHVLLYGVYTQKRDSIKQLFHPNYIIGQILLQRVSRYSRTNEEIAKMASSSTLTLK
jgi:hypothetical protein